MTEKRLGKFSGLTDPQKLYQDLVETSQDLIWQCDAEGRYTFLNQAWEMTFGYEVQEMLGRNFTDFQSPEIGARDMEVFAAIMGGKTVKGHETIHVGKSGNKIHLVFNAKAVYDDDGNAIGTRGTAYDITKRKLAEQETIRIKAAIDATGDAIGMSTPDGRHFYQNAAFNRMFGYTLEDVSQMHPIKLYANENEGKRVFEDIMSGKSWHGEVDMTDSSGRRFPVLLRADAIKDDKGDIIGLIGVHTDMTEKRKLLETAQRADKLDSIGVLAGGIAHDFNNLLSGMFGYLDLARRSCSRDQATAAYIDYALSVFNRAKDLTQQLLTFSRGGAPVRKTGHLGSFIVKSAKFALSGSKIRCTFRIAPDLRPCDFDENQLGQVMNNIIINAQQAMPMGGEIQITAENVDLKDGDHLSLKSGSYVKMSISDTGTGIQPKILKKIFDPFFSTKHEGYGLGLATCYSIMQKHDGYIDVESTPNKGSTFFLFLRASTKIPVLESPKPSSAHRGRGYILVMDDQIFIRDLVRQMLEDMGYRVFTSKDGEETLQFCVDAMERGIPLKCAILDLTIPGRMDAKTTLSELKKLYPEIPIFASSGYSDDPIMSDPTEYGFTSSIRKPYLIDELAEMLNKHLK